MNIDPTRVEEAPSFPLRPFQPAPWLPGPHLQTLAGKVLRPRTLASLVRCRLDTPDGDFLDLDLGPEPPEQSPGGSSDPAPLVLVLHGLEGSSRRRYALLAYRTLLLEGIRPVGMNFRGCSGETNRRARFYHSGETGDLAFVLDELKRRFPQRRLGALGFSLGGNVLLKFLGEEGEKARRRLAAAATVSVPFDLAAGADQLERGFMGRFYTTYFLRMLKEKMREKRSLLEARVDLEKGLGASTLREFDDVVTAPLHGFRDAGEYYRISSSAAYLGRVGIPTLLLQSRDDPFLPPEALPEKEIQGNPHLVSVLTEVGGHVGFVEGSSPWTPRFWAEEEAARFLALELGAGSGEEEG